MVRPDVANSKSKEAYKKTYIDTKNLRQPLPSVVESEDIMAISTKGNIGFVHSGDYYCLSFNDCTKTRIDFESNIDNHIYLAKLLFTGEIKGIYSGASRTIPGQKLLMRAYGDDVRNIEVIIKDDLFGELFHQTYTIDDEAKKAGEEFLMKQV